MKFFIDGADVNEIRELAATGMIDGVTTNPTLIAKTGRPFRDVIAEICAIVPGPVSAEVTATDYDGMLKQAATLSAIAANIKSGFDVVAEFIGLRSAIAKADVVITGEGRLDEQSLEGKAPAGVARLAREAGKPVFAIAGSASDAPAVRAPFDAVLVLARPPITPAESIARAPQLLQERARELAGMM